MERSSYTHEQLAEDNKGNHPAVLVEDNHVPATQDGTLPTHQIDPTDPLQKTSGDDVDAGAWTESGDGTEYPDTTDAARQREEGLENS